MKWKDVGNFLILRPVWTSSNLTSVVIVIALYVLYRVFWGDAVPLIPKIDSNIVEKRVVTTEVTPSGSEVTKVQETIEFTLDDEGSAVTTEESSEGGGGSTLDEIEERLKRL